MSRNRTSAAAPGAAGGITEETASGRVRRQKGDFTVSLAPVNLSKVPSEAELMAAGGLSGPLSPLGNSNVKTFKEILGREFGVNSAAEFDAAADIGEQLNAQALIRARQKVKRLEAINLSFGKAINERNASHFDVTARLMNEHLEKYPDSPWVGEALLHLAMDATSNGRTAEAQARLQALLDITVEDSSDPTWEIRSKAKVTWANLDVAMGQWDDAIPKLQDIIASDENRHRRKWALGWLAQARQLKNIRTAMLRACGSEALGVMLASVSPKASQAVAGAVPPDEHGFSLEEMTRLAGRQGVALKGFRITASSPKLTGMSRGVSGKAKSGKATAGGRVEQLAKLPLPLIIHFDMARYSANVPSGLPRPKTNFGLQKRGAAWTSSPLDKTSTTTSQTERKIAANRPHCPECLPPAMAKSPQANQAKAVGIKSIGTKGQVGAKVTPSNDRLASSRRSSASVFRPRSVGHYLVVRQVDLAARRVTLEDPVAHTGYKFSFDQLEREWSGEGLMFAPQTRKAPLPQKNLRVARLDTATIQEIGLQWLSRKEMTLVRGGCCCPWWPFGGPGMPSGPGPGPTGPGGNSCPGGKGSPVVRIDPLSLNTYIHDTPLWYSPAIGPSVKMTFSYSSQDTTMYSAFGNNWRLNFGGSLVESPGGQVFVTESDGSTSIYVRNAANTAYVGEAGNFNTLTRPGTNQFVLTTPTGEKNFYGRPRDNSNNVINLPVLVLNEVQDRFGNGVQVRYESYNRPVSGGAYTAQLVRITRVIDAMSQITTFAYNSGGFCTKITDPFGRQARFGYNSSGQMTSSEDMAGDSFTYAYDSEDIVTSIQTAQGTWNLIHQFPATGYNNTIDGVKYLDFITKVTDPSNRSNYYQLTGHPGSSGFYHTDANGNETWYYSSDAINNRPVVTAIKSADGTQTNLAYDHRSGQVSSIRSPSGKTISTQYNALGNPTRVTDPMGNTSQSIYASNGIDLTTVKNARGNTISEVTYNSQHLPLTVTTYPTASSSSYVTSMTYKTWGVPATVTNPKNEVTTYNYDSTSKRLTSITRSGPSLSAVTVASYTYDNIGRLQTVTDAAGVTKQIQYNDLDKPIQVTYSDGTTQKIDYVCCRLPGVITDRQGRKTYYDYDESMRLRRIQDANGYTLQYDYDNAGNMVSLLDSRGAYTRWDYDTAYRLIRKTYSDGSREGYAYDTDGQLIRSYDGYGAGTKYEYNSNGQLTLIDYPSAPDAGHPFAYTADESFTYNDLNQRTSMTDAMGTTYWLYDLLGRPLNEDGPWSGDTVSYSYDELSRATYQNIGGSYGTSFSYDGLGRLTDVNSPAGSGANNWHWAYDPTYVGNSSLPTQLKLPNGALAKYSWSDPLKRLTAVQNLKSDATTLISHFGYSFGASSEKSTRTSLVRQMRNISNVLGTAQTISYGYDPTDQLTSEISNETVPQVKSTFSYDAMGNRSAWKVEGAGIGGSTAQNVRHSATANRLNQLPSISTLDTSNVASASNSSYDARGNMMFSENTASDRYALYYYDNANRLSQILWLKRPNQPNPNQQITQSLFAYDALGRRRRVWERTFNTTTLSWQTSSDTRYVFSGRDVVQERETSTNAVKVNYTRCGNIGGLLARQSYTTGGTLDTTSYYHYDGSGNVVQLSDASQNVQAAYWYDAFGNTGLVQENIGYSQNFRYSTKWYHNNSGFYDYGSRFYNPSTGRWINRDPIQEKGGINMYSFVGNSSVNLGDPYGLSGVQFGSNGFNVGWGDPTFILSEKDLEQGKRYALDTLDPFGNPWLDCGGYNPNDPVFQGTRWLTYISATAGLGAGGIRLGAQAIGAHGLAQNTATTLLGASGASGAHNVFSSFMGSNGSDYTTNNLKSDFVSGALGGGAGGWAGMFGPTRLWTIGGVMMGDALGPVISKELFPDGDCGCD